jgi:PPOX class probable F420-dependent enzyme
VTRAVANRREQIRLTAAELERFLAAQRVMSVCTNGGDGWPHVTALWYVMRGAEPWIYTYRKSQKVRNLERDDRATLLVEDGVEYQELRGVMLKTRAVVHHDTDTVMQMAEDLFLKYQGGGGAELDDTTRAALAAQVSKRVAIQFAVEETVSWDHAKLGGTY